MKEIKFRGKDKFTGNWVYGGYHKNDSGKVFIAIGSYLEDVGFCLVQVDPETVGQYTVKKDKNGKDIYDGDIVSGCNGSINGSDWSWGPFTIEWKEEKARFNVPLWGTLEEHDSTHWFEIIGTIHDKEKS